MISYAKSRLFVHFRRPIPLMDIVAALTICAGCSAPPQDPGVAGNPAEEDTAVAVENDSNPPPRLSESVARLRELTQLSRDDLATRLSIDESEITVVEARHVVWPDGSVGCPTPGFNYTQVLTEGVLIRLQADSRTYQYHGGRVGPAFLCDKPPTHNPASLYEEE